MSSTGRKRKRWRPEPAAAVRPRHTCLILSPVVTDTRMHARGGIPFGNAAAAQVAREEERASATTLTDRLSLCNRSCRATQTAIWLCAGRAAVQAIALIKKGTKWQPGGLTAKDGKVWWCSRCNYKNAPRWRCGMWTPQQRDGHGRHLFHLLEPRGLGASRRALRLDIDAAYDCLLTGAP